MTYLEKAQNIYKMLFEGKLMDAFEKYYAENVVKQELGEEPRIGKEINRQYEKNFLESVKEIHGAGIDAIASDEAKKIVFIENWMDITFKNDVRVNMKQVNVQHWEGDFVVKETFYHK